jgi:hypothetical protein
MNAPVIGKKPAWWLLYLDGAALVALVALLEVSVAAEAPRLMLEIGVVIGMFTLMLVWLRINRGRIELAESAATRHAALQEVAQNGTPPRPAVVAPVPWKPARPGRRTA